MDPDRDLASTAPSEGRRARFDEGAALFDAGAYWDAHEVWEMRWRVEGDLAAKRFFQGMIQVAAALHKLRVQRAPDAAARLFAKALDKLGEAPCDLELDLARVRAGVEGCALALAEGRFDPAAVPALRPRPAAAVGGVALRGSAASGTPRARCARRGARRSRPWPRRSRASTTWCSRGPRPRRR